ncbi:MAG: hypothetical protein LBI73_15735 [Myroides sp.]|nr:hypothetical protein [Myroides sp.]
MRKWALIALGALSLVLTSCMGVKPVVSDYEIFYERSKGILESELGNGRVLFFNGGYFITTYTPLKATMINLKLNGKNVPTTQLGEFFVLRLGYGEYEFETEVRDVVWKRSKYQIEITPDTKLVKLMPSGIGRNVKVVKRLPDYFRNYRYVEIPSKKK